MAAPLENYEKELSNALWWARTNASLHAVTRFLGFCILTWGSVVLLRAFSSYLLLLDFAFIAILLLLEAVRLVYASSFIGLPTRAVAHLSEAPKLIIPAKDGRYPATRQYALILQFILLSPSFVIPFICMFSIADYGAKIPNLHSSLFIFYSFVALNSFVALVNLSCSTLAFVSLNKPRPEQSILRYYDKVLENAMSVGVIEADDFEFFSFAYRMLGSEYGRNVQPEAVAKNFRKLIQYLYEHRIGGDVLQRHMDAEDAWVQLAAVNMVGFWAAMGLKEVELPEEVLTKLADKVGTTGQVGWAATTSFGVLARQPDGARLMARTHTRGGLSLPDHLADLVDATSCRSLSLVRTLASFYEQLCMSEKQVPKPFSAKAESDLVVKLQKLTKGANVHRLRVQAAYLVLMMGEECDAGVIVAIDPMQDTYWYQSEVAMLHLIHRRLPYHASNPLELPPHLAIRKDPNITPPPWVVQPR